MNNLSENSNIHTINSSQMSIWRSEFYALPINRLAQNVCTKSDPISACLRLQSNELNTPGKVHHEVPKLVKLSTDGPNWICAGLDLLRLAMSKDVELSAAYLFYWHKLERCYYFLHTVVKFLARCEPLDGRPFQYLMSHAVPDGGNWQMFVNLVKKYGVIPKQSYLASWSSAHPLHCNRMLRSKLHEFSSQLHAQFTFDGDAEHLPDMVQSMVEELYKIINICLGTPPLQFQWYNREKKQLETFTALSFYKSLVEPYYNLDQQICLGHDPRLSSCYLRKYRVAYNSNMVNGLQQTYNNLPMDVLLNIIVKSLNTGLAVWLVCDVQPIYRSKMEVFSTVAHNFEQVFSMAVGSSLDKAERMIYKEARPNTVLLLTGVTLDAQQQPLQFETIGKQAAEGTKKSKPTINPPVSDEAGAMAATQMDQIKGKVTSGRATILNVDWLQEFAFGIVVDSRFVPPAVLRAFQTQPSVKLPIWDPMGELLG